MLMFTTRVNSYTTRSHCLDENQVMNIDFHLQEGSCSQRQNLRNNSSLFYSSSRFTYLSVPIRKKLSITHTYCSKRRVRPTAATLAAQGSDRTCSLLIICACAVMWRCTLGLVNFHVVLVVSRLETTRKGSNVIGVTPGISVDA